jgi:uncharacterized membrane protein
VAPILKAKHNDVLNKYRLVRISTGRNRQAARHWLILAIFSQQLHFAGSFHYLFADLNNAPQQLSSNNKVHGRKL